jgi:zinc protease
VPTATPDEPFRAHAPLAGPLPAFVPAAATHARLANGIPVVLVSFPSQYCAITVFAEGGVLDVPRPSRVDVVNEMLSTMLRGTLRHPAAQEFEHRLAMLAMTLPTRMRSQDGVAIAGTVPVEKFADGVQVMTDLVLDASFEKETFERKREQDARALDAPLNAPSKVAELVLQRALFGAHPYATFPTAARTRAVSRSDVLSLYGRVFSASRISIVLAGGVAAEDAVKALENGFGKLAPGGTPAPPIPALTNVAGPPIVVVDKPGASVAFLAGGFPGPAGASDDALAARMATQIAMNGLLGRGARLRDEVGLLITAEARAWAWRWGGELGWRAQTANEHVPAALTEVDRILKALATEGPTAEELAVIRGWSNTGLLLGFETPSSVADTYGDLVLLHLPEASLASTSERIASVSAEDVRAAAAKYFDRTRMRVVVVGNLDALREPLTQLGWGPIEVRDAAGDIVPTKGAKAAAP